MNQHLVTYRSLAGALGLLKGALMPSQAFGFLYGVLTGPVTPDPSTNLSIIFNGHEPSTIRDAQLIIDEILSLHNQILESVYRSEVCELQRTYTATKTGLQHRVHDLIWAVRGYRIGLAAGGVMDADLEKQVPKTLERLKIAFAALFDFDRELKRLKSRDFTEEDYETNLQAITVFGAQIHQSFLAIFQHYQADRIKTMSAYLKQPSAKPSRDPGRNDPCPCGSGLKFKHCHGSGGTFKIH